MSEKNRDAKYHGVRPIGSIVKKMKREYDRDKKDWRVISSTDDDGNTDTLINKPPNSYWLKSKQLSPFSALSIGSVVRNIDKDIDEQVGRKMTPDDMYRFFGMVVPIKQDQNIIATGIEKFSQYHGDYLKKVISEKDSNLGPFMARHLDDEFIKKYPQRKGLYI